MSPVLLPRGPCPASAPRGATPGASVVLPHCGTAAVRHFSIDLRTQGHAVIKIYLWLIEKTVIYPDIGYEYETSSGTPVRLQCVPRLVSLCLFSKWAGWTERWRGQCCVQGLLSQGCKWTYMSSCINHLDISSFRCRCKWEVHLRTKESWDTFPALTCKLLQVLSQFACLFSPCWACAGIPVQTYRAVLRQWFWQSSVCVANGSEIAKEGGYTSTSPNLHIFILRAIKYYRTQTKYVPKELSFSLLPLNQILLF